MKKEIKVLIKKESAKHSSESILWGDNKFKIVAENDNCYSHLTIYIYTKNGDLGQVATEYDIPNYEAVHYHADENIRLRGNAKNIIAAEDYIKIVFKI